MLVAGAITTGCAAPAVDALVVTPKPVATATPENKPSPNPTDTVQPLASPTVNPNTEVIAAGGSETTSAITEATIKALEARLSKGSVVYVKEGGKSIREEVDENTTRLTSVNVPAQIVSGGEVYDFMAEGSVVGVTVYTNGENSIALPTGAEVVHNQRYLPNGAVLVREAEMEEYQLLVLDGRGGVRETIKLPTIAIPEGGKAVVDEDGTPTIIDENGKPLFHFDEDGWYENLNNVTETPATAAPTLEATEAPVATQVPTVESSPTPTATVAAEPTPTQVVNESIKTNEGGKFVVEGITVPEVKGLRQEVGKLNNGRDVVLYIDAKGEMAGYFEPNFKVVRNRDNDSFPITGMVALKDTSVIAETGKIPLPFDVSDTTFQEGEVVEIAFTKGVSPKKDYMHGYVPTGSYLTFPFTDPTTFFGKNRDLRLDVLKQQWGGYGVIISDENTGLLISVFGTATRSEVSIENNTPGDRILTIGKSFPDEASGKLEARHYYQDNLGERFNSWAFGPTRKGSEKGVGLKFTIGPLQDNQGITEDNILKTNGVMVSQMGN